MFKLPETRNEKVRVNPRKIILFSKPKVGKTEAISRLDNCLLIDVEEGSEYVSAMKIDIIAEARKQGLLPIVALQKLIEQLQAENTKKGQYLYKYGVIDTVTALEEIALPYAGHLYRSTPQGKNWQGDDVTTLPNGAGYWFLRKALSQTLNDLEKCFETLIILGHVKDKLVETNGKEMNERGLDLTGKSAAILCSQVDAIGYLYREDNKTIVNFKPSDSLTCGARSEHLKDAKITLIEKMEDGTLKVDWSKIFID